MQLRGYDCSASRACATTSGPRDRFGSQTSESVFTRGYGEFRVFKNTGVCGSSQRFEVLSDPNTRGVPILYWGRGVSVGLPHPSVVYEGSDWVGAP